MQSIFAIGTTSAIFLAAIAGLVVGSWLTRVVDRLPRIMDYDWEAQFREWRGEATQPEEDRPSLWRRACRCPACQAPVTGWRRLPLLGWLLLRGRCGACGQSISWRYPVLEGMTALGFAACVWRFGPGVQAVWAMLLVAGLLALAWIDMDTGLLPDVITLPLLWAGLLANVADTFAPTTQAVLGAAVGYGLLWLLFHGYRMLTGREGMGYGDFKLLAALGAWLGLAALPLLLLAASLTGALAGLFLIATRRARRGQPQPFGPYLAAAGIVALFCGGLPPGWLT
ncbi:MULTISPECIES: A24 family peptidase [unclassified Achromobacter]|uniref:prepilin peptidase n=1 Tax=unclassified Achromobacter TaxID=2626865 RepID=UPI000B51CDB7|nr:MULTISPECIES: A24 family peptidase [unclassified Achromobacter]OWT75625.1 prepilin peptidase [Achromobacter sp. HZ28]OWT76286.1 prepilin peptidase [Achromobacter sp. HZ34]